MVVITTPNFLNNLDTIVSIREAVKIVIHLLNPFLDSVIFRLLKIELSKNNNLIFYFSKISII